eukprot:gene23016-30209_t
MAMSNAKMVARAPMRARTVGRTVVAPKALFGGGAKTGAKGFYDYEVKDIDGKSIKMDKFKGKAVLVVNLASACGFTPQYTELEGLQKKFANKNFSVVGFPCNQFGGQEPGSNADIKKFATNNYKVTFPLMSKVDVNGPGEDPVFGYLKSQKGELFGSDVKWNFSKFLVDKEGNVVNRYPSMTAPAQIEADIAKLL